MNETFADIGYREPEPDESLKQFLRVNENFRAVCREHGWWLETIEEIEGK